MGKNKESDCYIWQ